MAEKKELICSQTEVKLPVDALLNWFDFHKRYMPWRQSRDPYHIWVSEVMLQQTQVETVIPYYDRFMEHFPTLISLAKAQLDEVMLVWQGLGYYQRARNLHRSAREVVEKRDGFFPTERLQMLSLPGVGEYIAAAILSMVNSQPLAVIDGNVIRVCSRFWGIGSLISTPRHKRLLADRLEQEMPAARCGDFNQALMELGATVCRPRSWNCGICPLYLRCSALDKQTQGELPVKADKKKRPRYQVALAIIVSGEEMLIQKRKETGHLGGLWEFPGGKLNAGETALEALKRECLEEIGCEFHSRFALKPFVQVYSHFEVEIIAYVGIVGAGVPHALQGQPLKWIPYDRRLDYAFPAANQRIFYELGAWSEIKAQLEAYE